MAKMINKCVDLPHQNIVINQQHKNCKLCRNQCEQSNSCLRCNKCTCVLSNQYESAIPQCSYENLYVKNLFIWDSADTRNQNLSAATQRYHNSEFLRNARQNRSLSLSEEEDRYMNRRGCRVHADQFINWPSSTRRITISPSTECGISPLQNETDLETSPKKLAETPFPRTNSKKSFDSCAISELSFANSTNEIFEFNSQNQVNDAKHIDSNDSKTNIMSETNFAPISSRSNYYSNTFNYEADSAIEEHAKSTKKKHIHESSRIKKNNIGELHLDSDTIQDPKKLADAQNSIFEKSLDGFKGTLENSINIDGKQTPIIKTVFSHFDTSSGESLENFNSKSIGNTEVIVQAIPQNSKTDQISVKSFEYNLSEPDQLSAISLEIKKDLAYLSAL